MKNMMRWFNQPPVDGPDSTVLLRLMVGGVFFWEGILKFVYVNQGLGRFTKLGMPFPMFTADFVGGLEIVGGLLLMAGLLTRWIAVPFINEMIVAMLSTKISFTLGRHLCRCRRRRQRSACGQCCTRFAPSMRKSWSCFSS